MKALDTNVLVRYLTRDDEKQAAAAKRVIHEAASSGEPLLLQPIVLVELVWVLARRYEAARAEIAVALEEILVTGQFEVHDKKTLWQALDDYRSGKGDFADYYIGRANESAGAETTLTFDKALRADPRFRVIRS